jgi:SAM-dependent methyltransferase
VTKRAISAGKIALHKPPRTVRRALGAYYTPPDIAAWLAQETLGPLLLANPQAPCLLLDPACGDGALLAAAGDFLLHAGAVSRARLCGVDIDPTAIAAAEQTFSRRNLPVTLLNRDSLTEEPLNRTFPEAEAQGGFDAVLGNPPFVSIRELARSQPAGTVTRYRREYYTARGNFDLYVLFVELALRVLRPGGRCGLILPNKWAGLDYAHNCRELLLRESRLETVLDLSTANIFPGAEVYPHALVFEKRPQAIFPLSLTAEPPLRVLESISPAAPGRPPQVRQVARNRLTASAFCLGRDWSLEDRVPCRPLGQLAYLASGASGYTASKLLGALLEASDPSATPVAANCRDFIVSGNVDRFAVKLGAVQFLRKRFVRPLLDLSSPAISAEKRKLYAAPKIVLSGMGKRLKAAWDEIGPRAGRANVCRRSGQGRSVLFAGPVQLAAVHLFVSKSLRRQAPGRRLFCRQQRPTRQYCQFPQRLVLPRR